MIELYKASPGPKRGRPQTWRFRFRSPNGRIMVAATESYTNREDAMNAARTVFGADAEIVDVSFDPEVVAL